MEPIKISTEITKAFGINIQEVQEMVGGYQILTLVPNDTESYGTCRKALTACIKTRTGIDKRRLELNAEDQKQIKARNSVASQLTDLIAPAESHLSELVKGEDARKEAIKAEEERIEKEKIQGRVDALMEYKLVLPFMEVALWTDEEFETKLTEAKTAFEAEVERLAKEKAEREAEDARIIAERAELTRMREEQERQAKIQEEAEKALVAERKALEDAKQAEVERVNREAFEKQAKENALVQAEKDAAEKVEREAREAKEREEAEKAEGLRLEALKPDRTKLLTFAENLMESKNGLIPELTFGSPAYPILLECEFAVETAIKELVKKVEVM